MVKKALLSFSSSMAITTVACTALAVTGVGAVLAAGTALSVKAARTIGMYKLNKKAGTVKAFDATAADATAASDRKIVEYRFKEASVSTDKLATTVSKGLLDMIDYRVDSDQAKNRKTLAKILGATVIGVTAGAILHSIFESNGSGGSGHTGGSPTTEHTSPTTGPTTTDHVTTTSSPRPTSVPNSTTSPSNSVPRGTGNSKLPPTRGNSNTPTPTDGTGGNVDPTATSPTQVMPLPETSVLHVPNGQGFENSIQQQFGLSDAQSHEAFMAMKPYLNGQSNTYMQGSDIRISVAGDMQLNPQASAALQNYLKTLSETTEGLPETA
jgi:hypothetical protein